MADMGKIRVLKGHLFLHRKKSIFLKMRIVKDFIKTGSGFVHMNTTQNQWETQSDVKNDLAVNWGHGAGASSLSSGASSLATGASSQV